MAKKGDVGGPTPPAPSKSQLNKGIKKAQQAAREATAKAEQERLAKIAAKQKPKAAPVTVPDTTTARAKIMALSVEDLDRHADHGYTTFDGIKDETAHTSKPPKLKGGWWCKWLFKAGRESLILLPESPRTIPIWEKGQRNWAMEQGLTEAQAKAFVGCKQAHKHLLLPYLVDVLRSSPLTRQYLAYREYPYRAAWMKAWNIQDDWNAAHHESLIVLLELMIETEKKAKAQRFKELEASTASTMDEAMTETNVPEKAAA